MQPGEREPEERLWTRNEQIYRKHVLDGRTQTSVAREYGITQSRVSEICQQVRDSFPERSREVLVTDCMEMLRELQMTAMEMMRMAGAPVTAGKDGTLVYDPDTNEPVRDYSLRLNALKGALNVQESMRRLVGLDAAKGLELNVTGAEQAAALQLGESAARRVSGADGAGEED